MNYDLVKALYNGCVREIIYAIFWLVFSFRQKSSLIFKKEEGMESYLYLSQNSLVFLVNP